MDARIGVWPRAIAMPLGSLAHISLDLVMIIAGFWLAYQLRYEHHFGGRVAPESYRPFRDFLPLVAILAAILVPILVARGLYRFADGMNHRSYIQQLVSCTVLAFMALSAFVFYTQAFFYSRLLFLYALVFVTAFLAFLEVCYLRVGYWVSNPGCHRTQLADIVITFGILLLGLPLMLNLLLRHWFAARRASADQPPETEIWMLAESAYE